MGPRPGFALLTAVLALVVISLVGAVVVLPLAEVSVHQQRVQDTHGYLVRLTDTDKRGFAKFVELHGQAPSEMVHLSNELPAGAVGACGKKYRTPGDWEPQSDRVFVTVGGVGTGVPTPIGVIANQLVLVDSRATLEIMDVHLADAERLDGMADAETGGAAGRVRWVVSDAVQDLVTLQWLTAYTC